MATITTTQFGNNKCPQAQLVVTEDSSTNTSVTYAWTLKWVTHSGLTVSTSSSKAYTVKIDGDTVKTGSFAIGGKTSTTIASGKKTIDRGKSSRSVSMYLSFAMTFTWHGKSGGTRSASDSFTIGAKTSYTIKFDPNGGSGAPGNLTKWHGDNTTIPSTKPTRTGYNFVRWNANKDNTSGIWYNPGDTCGYNGNLTLYAIWSPYTYKVHYDANSGSNAPGDQTKTYGQNLTLSSTKPTRTNYNFLGWSTSPNGGVVYAPGATYTGNAELTLYAVWELAYVKPRINNFNVQRCTSNGTANESGTYLKYTFDWATDYNVLAISLEWSTKSDFSTNSHAQVTASGKSGSVSQIVGNGEVSIENTYYVRAYIKDGPDSTANGTYSTILSIGTIKFPIDVRNKGKGVAFGKVAEIDDLFDVNFNAKFRKSILGDTTFNDLVICKELYTNGGIKALPTGNDNLNYWSKLQNGWYWYGNTKAVPNMPSSYGFVEKRGFLSGDFTILFYTQSSGTIYRKSGNSNSITGWIRIYQTQRVLWEGAIYMNGSQTATLSERVSEQVNGIVLVFSGYSNGEAKNWNTTCRFIPKEKARLFNGAGEFIPIGGLEGISGYKYLYIYDDRIEGNDKNQQSISNGITYNNDDYVLRYVIGV